MNKVDAAGGDKQQAMGGYAGDVPSLRVRRGNTNRPRKTTLLVAARKVRAVARFVAVSAVSSGNRHKAGPT